MAFTLGEEEPFDRDAAQGRQVDYAGVFHAVAEASARRDERSGKRQRANRDREIHEEMLNAECRMLNW
jgi:hypothetical protein